MGYLQTYEEDFIVDHAGAVQMTHRVSLIAFIDSY